MKKLLFFFVLIASINGLKAQIINFPDANFKIKLLSSNSTQTGTNIVAKDNVGTAITIDLNSDNEISVQEAQLIYSLDISQAAVSDLTGIENFINLVNLNCYKNQISTLDLSKISNLYSLNCNSNQISTLDFSKLSNLYSIDCGYNQINSIDISNSNNLATLFCDHNQLSILDLSNNKKLIYLDANNNSISNLDLTNLNILQTLHCYNNLLTSLNLAMTNTSLYLINCSYNQLTVLSIPSSIDLSILNFRNNQISTINLSNCPSLTLINSDSTLLSTLDVSQNKLLDILMCNGLKNLKSLNLKNGHTISLSFGLNSNLKYICLDDIQKDSILPKLAAYNYTNIEVNTYCSFKPGGDYNTITGNIIYDLDKNGCDQNDPKNITFTKVKFLDGINSRSTFTNTSGIYNFYTPKGTFLIKPYNEDTTLFSFSPPTASITFADSLNHLTTQDFCITPIGSHSDVEVVLNPIQRARPGFDAHYQLVYKNKGNQTLTGTVNLLFNDSLIDLLSSSISPILTAVGNLTWDYATLKPFEIKTIDLIFHVNSPVQLPAVNIGDTLNFIATITPVGGDETPLDNVFNFKQIVVGAYDPNEVTCLEGDIIPSSSIGQYLHYTIDFENTGNFPAENIVVKEIIDPKKFDIQTLQILNSSNKVYTRIKGNQIEYIFEGIQLEDHNHGNILFKLKTRDTLTFSDTVYKSADIYFDYNLPVQTNNAKTTFQNLTAGLVEKMIDQTISVFPNPSNGVYTIKTENQTKQVEVFDAGGRLLIMKIGADNSSKVDITNQDQGIYFLKITTDKGVKVMEVSKN